MLYATIAEWQMDLFVYTFLDKGAIVVPVVDTTTHGESRH